MLRDIHVWATLCRSRWISDSLIPQAILRNSSTCLSSTCLHPVTRVDTAGTADLGEEVLAPLPKNCGLLASSTRVSRRGYCTRVVSQDDGAGLSCLACLARPMQRGTEDPMNFDACRPLLQEGGYITLAGSILMGFASLLCCFKFPSSSISFPWPAFLQCFGFLFLELFVFLLISPT